MAGPSSFSLGYSERELDESPYAPFFTPDLAPLAEAAREAVAIGAQSPELFPGLEAVPELVAKRNAAVKTGYGICRDGEVRVFELTPMPRVAPQMWEWWFAWHGDDAQKYKLWHPRAHVDVAWADGHGFTGAYVGRTSNVIEYIGAARIKGAIRFVPPSSLGIDEAALAERGEVLA